jgi:hypothetical protein
MTVKHLRYKDGRWILKIVKGENTTRIIFTGGVSIEVEKVELWGAK